MTRHARPEVVFFDVGMTLLYTEPSIADIYHEEAKAHGLEVTAARMRAALEQQWLQFARPYFHQPQNHVTSHAEETRLWRELHRRVAAAIDDRFDATGWIDGIEQRLGQPRTWRLFADALPTLRTLADRGVRLAVISNWDLRLRGLLSALELDAHFEHLQISAETGYRKPHPAIFLRALRAMRVHASRAWHVGDNELDDIQGASAIGVRAFHLQRDGASGAPSARGERVASLLELLDHC
ncbi:MAG: HAD-IA family hydrolase [Planctomycetota bacterium]